MKIAIFTYSDLGEIFCKSIIKEFEEIYIIFPKNFDNFYINRLIKNKIIKKKNVIIYKNDSTLKNIICKKKIDIAFSVGFPFKIKKKVFKLFKLGAFNIHPGLLPFFRGQHVINWAIISGAKKTGVAIHEIDESFDTGPIIIQKIIRINKFETAYSLNKKIGKVLVKMVHTHVSKFKKNNLKKVMQDDKKAKYWRARKISDGEIKLNMNCDEVDKLIRGLVRPWPGAFFIYRQKKIFIYKVKKVKKAPIQKKNNIFYHKKMYLFLKDGILKVEDAEVNKKDLTPQIFNQN